MGGTAADRDTAEACGLLGMCGLSVTTAGAAAPGTGGLLGSRRLPPLPPALAKALSASWRGRLGAAHTRLEAALGSPALRDTRCTACKVRGRQGPGAGASGKVPCLSSSFEVCMAAAGLSEEHCGDTCHARFAVLVWKDGPCRLGPDVPYLHASETLLYLLVSVLHAITAFLRAPAPAAPVYVQMAVAEVSLLLSDPAVQASMLTYAKGGSQHHAHVGMLL